MSSNDNMRGDLLLEDINTGKTFLLESSGTSYYCGRGKSNVINTQSILASRQHCIFIRTKQGLNIIDMGSANGIYINGVHKESKIMIALNINDIIGLGCPDVTPMATDQLKTIFRLRSPELNEINTYRPGQSRDSSQAASSARAGRVKVKEMLSIPEIIEIIEIADDSNDEIPVEIDERKIEAKSTDPCREASTSEKNTKSDQRRSSVTQKKAQFTEDTESREKKTEQHSFPSNAATRSTESSRRNEKMEQHSFPSNAATRSTESLRRNEKTEQHSFPSNAAIRSTKSSRRKEQATPIRRPKTVSSADEEMDILSREDLLDLALAEGFHSNRENVEELPNAGYTADKTKILVKPNDAVIDQQIKYEPELEIVDDDEDIYKDVSHFSQTPPPIKLRRVKLEPIMEYSQYDVVALSDDEDDVFPLSQLFGDEPDVETDSKVNIKNELIDENEEDEKEIFNNGGIDPLAIYDVSDSEDEDNDNSFYVRLMRAELNASRESATKRVIEGTEIEETALMSPKKAPIEEVDVPMSPTENIAQEFPIKEDADVPMSPTENIAREFPIGEDADVPMSPTENIAREFPIGEDADVPMSPTENIAQEFLIKEDADFPMSPTENIAREFLIEEEADVPMSPTENIARKAPIEEDANVPMSPTENIARESSIEEDVSESPTVQEIYDICFPTAKTKKSITDYENKRSIIEKKVAPQHPSGRDDSTTSEKTASSDKKKQHDKKRFHHDARRKSVDRIADSEDAELKTDKSKRHKHDDDNNKRDSTEENSHVAREAVGIADSGKKRNPVVVLTKLNLVRKSVPIVEAPFIANDQRRGVSIQKIEKSTSKPDAASPSSSRLSAKKKKELSYQSKIDKFRRMKEQKLRLSKNKWADVLPSRKKQSFASTSSMTREERDELKHDRKEKLKQIADKKKELADGNAKPVKRVPVKAKAKVTERTRNDFLVAELKHQCVKESAEPRIEPTCVDNRDESPQRKKRKSESSHLIANGEIPPVNSANFYKENHETESERRVEPIANVEASQLNTGKSPKGKKRKNESLRLTVNDEIPLVNRVNFYKENYETESERRPESSANVEASQVNGNKSSKGKKRKNDSLDSGKENAEMSVDEGANSIKNLSRTSIPEWRREEPIRNEREYNVQTGVPRASTMQNGSARILNASELVGGQTLNGMNEENESTVASRDPRIKTGNNLRKCNFKDVPSTINKNLPRRSHAVTTACPKLEQFLLRIFEWNPVWLEEQKKMRTPPPVVNEKHLVQMLPKYGTYGAYYEVAEPLLALELWHGISRDFDNGEVIQKGSMKFSIVKHSVTRTVAPLTDVHLTTLMIEVVVSQKQLQQHAHPVYGDLIFFEYISNIRAKEGGFQRWKVFAYVTKLHKATLTPFTQFNRDLLKFVQDPCMLLTFTVMTKPLNPCEMQTDKIERLGTISYLRSNIRLIQAIQYLPASPLLNTILHPKIEDYQLPVASNLESYPLVTKDNLNSKQLEAVARVTEAVVQRLPKICLIQGPPGTGKTKVIVNLITQILYGRGSNPNKKTMRILVCAPSNAAVDELVLRLLEIRRTFQKGNRFNMVRIGQDNAMHPMVKEISLNELVKKNVKSMTDIYMSPDFSAESIEEEKRIYQARKNSLELELATGRNLSLPRIKQLTRKLEDARANYDLLINRRPAEKLDPRESLRLQRAQENTLIKRADVIACTLSSCYTNTTQSIFAEGDASISVCIVDEATQSIEAETLVPLMLGVKTLVLVGDTNQLPATVLSQKAKQLGLDQSLFARIQYSFNGQQNNPIILLDTQYRMSYPVAFWPNRYFYGGALKNSANLCTLPFNFYKVINLDSVQDVDKFCNTNEANFVANVVYAIMARSNLKDEHPQIRIGIITPYNHQKILLGKKIKERIAMLTDKTKKKFVHDVKTVDSFQGQERDIIIMSCVRSNGIGFLSDRQRLCVALTRARHSLILCGNFTAFQRHSMWNSLLSDARARGAYLNMRSSSEVDEITRHIVR